MAMKRGLHLLMWLFKKVPAPPIKPCPSTFDGICPCCGRSTIRLVGAGTWQGTDKATGKYQIGAHTIGRCEKCHTVLEKFTVHGETLTADSEWPVASPETTAIVNKEPPDTSRGGK